MRAMRGMFVANAQVANRQMHTIENESLGIRLFFKMSFFIENMNC